MLTHKQMSFVDFDALFTGEEFDREPKFESFDMYDYWMRTSFDRLVETAQKVDCICRCFKS